MKKLLLRFLVVATLATTAISFTGCAHSEHEKHAGMSCAKCSCKMMEPDAANPDKCKMCGHSKAEHSEHQH